MLSTSAQTTHEAPTEFQVLVVDDYDDNREMLRIVLQRQGIKVVEARDGIEAVKVAYLSRPDLILMDISMPVMDGLEAVRQLKGVESTRNIPIVVISAHCGDPQVVRRVHDAGCSHCLPKPFDLSEVTAIVQGYKTPTSTT